MTPTTQLPRFLQHCIRRRDHDEPEWLKERRDIAFSWISEHGFPTPKDETWKYTPIDSLLNVSFEHDELQRNTLLNSSIIDLLVGNFSGTRIAFINGHFFPEISSLTNLPQGVKVKNLASAFREENETFSFLFNQLFQERAHAFSALNTVCSKEGAFIKIPANITIEEPIHIVFVSDTQEKPIAVQPRSFIHVGARSHVKIIETYVGTSGTSSFTNAVTEIVLDEDAKLSHYKIQTESEASFHIGLSEVKQAKNSEFESYFLSHGSKLARNEIKIKLQATGASSCLNGLYISRKEQVLDNLIVIDHSAPQCNSQVLYKGVVGEQARGIFDGQILVQEGATKADATLTNKNLLLSDSAQAHTKPLLKIFTDDVKCSHGATVGYLNEDSIFYLRSRGIPEEDAQSLLTHAFASEMLEKIQLKSLQSYVEKRISDQIYFSNHTKDRI